MSAIRVQMFGKLRIQVNGQEVVGLEGHKVQELICYLLLHRNRSHPREALADLLWERASTAQAKKYLRQALWQLQSALGTQADAKSDSIFVIEPDWIHVRESSPVWLDAAEFEVAFARARETPGAQLDHEVARSLEAAVGLYRGDLLNGWYHDWCLFERERLQNIYIAMLNKLIGYCDTQRRYDAGLAYGERILRIDAARESTHRWMMRLYYEVGERTEALRQYERCVAALDRALGVRPSSRTTALYDRIRLDQAAASPPLDLDLAMPEVPIAIPDSLLGRLQHLRLGLGSLERQLGKEIESIERVLAPASAPQ